MIACFKTQRVIKHEMQARDVAIRRLRRSEEIMKLCTNMSVLNMMLFMGYEKEVQLTPQQELLAPSCSICSSPWGMDCGKSSGCLLLFSEPGDTHLGHILAGYNPNDNSFGALTPHFAVDNPAQDENLNESMNQMHGSILTRLKDIASNPYIILLLFLA